MKKTLLALAMASVSLLSVNNAQADNKSSMKFIGVVQASSCDIDASDLSNINMPDVTQKDFSGKGSKSGEQSFTVKISDCPNTVKHAQIGVTGTADKTDSSLLAIDAGDSAAKGIAISLSAQGQKLAVNTAKSVPLPVKNGAASFSMTAQYVATSDEVVSGAVTATAQASITYM